MNFSNLLRFIFVFWGIIVDICLYCELSKKVSILKLVNKNVIKFSEKFVNVFICIMTIILILIISEGFALGKFNVTVDKLSVGGINILFDNPDDIFTKDMKNYLNTKRSLFYIKPEKDNFYETLNSYYDTYNFIRNEMKIYPSSYSDSSEKYAASQNVISELNNFLTDNQNDFRRWYEIEIKNENDYDIDIGTIQKKYRHYDDLILGFQKVNEAFQQYGKLIGVDYDKWK